MPITVKDIEIKGTKYQVRQLGGLMATKVVARVGVKLIPALLQVASDMHEGRPLNLPAFESIAAEDVEWLMDVFAKNTRVGIVDTRGDGRTTYTSLDTVFDDHFAGKWLESLLFLKSAAEVTFGNFTDALALLAPPKQAASSSNSPQASSGSPGDSSSPNG